MNKLTNLEWIKNRIKELIVLRRELKLDDQKRINIQLEWLYNQKYNLLKEQQQL